MPKTALVVDDSRVALVGLSRLLKAQGWLVDTSESGPETLGYLRLNPPPAVIFLDHMMPGMDGFETLAALKSNPATSAIPVVMYTSKEETGYIEEARGLGVADVLLKPPQPLAIARILASLHLSEDRTVSAYDAEAASVSVPRLVAASVVPRVAVRHSAPIPPPAMVAPPRHAPPPAVVEPVVQRRSGLVYLGWALVALLLGAAISWEFTGYRALEQARAELAAENTQLKIERARREALDQAQTAATTQTRVPVPSALSSRALLDALAWALNAQGRYDFGDIPFGNARLELVRELTARLSDARFRGVVRLDADIGEFCLVRDDQGRYRLPPRGTPFSECEVVTYPPAEAVRLAEQQSQAFTDYLAEQAAARTPIKIVIVSHGASRPYAHPPDSSVLTTASQWNAVARLNQRVTVTLLPARENAQAPPSQSRGFR